MKMKLSALAITTICFLAPLSHAASVEKANMLNQHGLRQEAKVELIDIIFSKASDADKAKAYYTLGSIAFDESKVSTALDSWRVLVQKYPNSSEATSVKDRIRELAEIVGESTKESVNNAVALSYLRHGDFWSDDKDNVFTIDSSWIPKVETAIKWYDKVIAEFPKSNASKIAYRSKLRTLLGWKERGQYGSSFGIRSDFAKYMPKLLETFAAFEQDHPSASSLQAFRYQIAQAYWSNKDWAKTREWLNLILGKADGTDSFYKDLAERRLQKIEY